MAELPKFIALKSVKNQKYLVYKDHPKLPDMLQCSGKEGHSQDARFEVEKDVHQPSLVHIKSTYNDKYWRKASPDSSWIVAGADEKQPNKTLWSCTLFKLVGLQSPEPYVEGVYGVYSFVHVQMENLIEPKSGTELDDALTVVKATATRNPVFIVEKRHG